MPEDAVLYETREALAFIPLNRPERLNAINGPLIAGLTEAVARANREPEVRVIVLRGAGRAFCAGYDLQMAPQAEAAAQERSGGRGARPARLPRRPPGPGGGVVRREAGDDADEPAGDDQAPGEPGLREHGAAHDADPGDVPGRDRAAHAGGAGLARDGDAGGVPGGGPPPRRALGGPHRPQARVDYRNRSRSGGRTMSRAVPQPSG